MVVRKRLDSTFDSDVLNTLGLLAFHSYNFIAKVSEDSGWYRISTKLATSTAVLLLYCLCDQAQKPR